MTKSTAVQSPVSSQAYISTPQAPAPRFEVPTRKFPLSSGFPYHRQLFHFRVSPDEWSRFTDDVVRASSLSTLAQWAVWGTGVTVGAASSALLLVFGIPPGYYAGKAVYNKAVTKRVREGLREEGELEAIMRFWNETVFVQKGCRVRLEFPCKKKGKETASDDAVKEPTKKRGSFARRSNTEEGEKDNDSKQKKNDKLFKLVVEPLDRNDMTSPLVMSPELDVFKEGDFGVPGDRSTVSTMPLYSTQGSPAYGPGPFVQELEAISPATAVESSARSIREMPGTTKTVND